MKKILESTPKTREYLESLPKVYMIARWAGYGVREFPFAGKCTTDGIPFVWTYDDCNGTCDCYFLRKLTNTTTGWIYAWTISKGRAEEIAAALNEKDWGELEESMMSIILSSIAIVLSTVSLLIMFSIDRDNKN